MSRKTRASANAPENATLSVNERILKDCHSLYVDEERGLIGISEKLDLALLAPRKKITVLLIGNHSAGKSSFINWYVEEHVQRTGVAIETQGFTFITSGRKRESLTGNATLHLYPHFEPLRKLQGVVDYLTTEISTSKQKKFSLVTFVDSPGLVDGDMVYPFDVDESLTWLGDLADLIFVFFDPMGQALCKRTLNIVEALNHKHPERIRFYLTKADTAGSDSDRQRVMMQIVQELCKRPGLNKAAFDMPAIFIPSLTAKNPRCENQIDQAAKEVSKAIDQMIQSTLNTLEKDCKLISSTVDEKLERDVVDRSYNLRARGKGLVCGGLGLFFPMLLFLHLLTRAGGGSFLESVVGEGLANEVVYYVTWLFTVVPDDSHTYAYAANLFLCLVFLMVARYVSRTRPTLPRRERRALADVRTYVQDSVKTRKAQLYKEYLQQSVGSEFMS